MKKLRLLGAFCAFMFQGLSTVESATIMYTNETDFLSAAGTTILEDFESYSVAAQEGPISTTYFTVSTTPTLGGTSSFIRIDGGDSSGLDPVDGVKTLVAGSSTNAPFTLTFDLLSPTTVCATRDPGLFAAVPLWNENHSILNGSFRDAVPAHGAMLAQS